MERPQSGLSSDPHLKEHFKLELVRQWDLWFQKHTGSYEGDLGMDLAYLWPAILNDKFILVHKDSTIYKLLVENKVPSSDPIWNYIKLEDIG